MRRPERSGNPDFVARAPQEAAEDYRERLADTQAANANAKLEGGRGALAHAAPTIASIPDLHRQEIRLDQLIRPNYDALGTRGQDSASGALANNVRISGKSAFWRRISANTVRCGVVSKSSRSSNSRSLLEPASFSSTYSRKRARKPPNAFSRATRITSRFNPSTSILNRALARSTAVEVSRGRNSNVPGISSPSGVVPPRSSSKKSIGSSMRGSIRAETPGGGGTMGSLRLRTNSVTR